jgi:hypothetical protein
MPGDSDNLDQGASGEDQVERPATPEIIDDPGPSVSPAMRVTGPIGTIRLSAGRPTGWAKGLVAHEPDLPLFHIGIRDGPTAKAIRTA